MRCEQYQVHPCIKKCFIKYSGKNTVSSLGIELKPLDNIEYVLDMLDNSKSSHFGIIQSIYASKDYKNCIFNGFNYNNIKNISKILKKCKRKIYRLKSNDIFSIKSNQIINVVRLFEIPSPNSGNMNNNKEKENNQQYVLHPLGATTRSLHYTGLLVVKPTA